ncbi:MAG: hypothetical protein Q8Q92_01210 [bacterium]|nr:hypothetical protein [bacterium]
MEEESRNLMNDIIPAILATSIPDFSHKISEIPEKIKFVHIDVLETDIWADIHKDFEVHLMVVSPEEIMERWVKRGAKRIVVHKLNDVTKRFKGRVEIGLGVELHVPLEEIFPLIPQIDFLHLMSIAEIGEQGHPLDERIFDRIKEIKKKFPQVPISVDGGINTTNYQALRDAGADRLVVGSGFKDLWKSLTKN